MQRNYPLTRHNSFGIQVRASLFSAPENLDQLVSLTESYNFHQFSFLVLGEGSNLLFTKDFEGLVIHPALKGIEIELENSEEVWIRVGASVNWDAWVVHSIQQGWYGLENLSLIPGSVGSSPIQNIGAYGVEMKDRIAWLDAWDLFERKLVRKMPEECEFGYRTSLFKTQSPKRYIITHVTFRLQKKPDLQLQYGHVRESFMANGGSTPADLRNTIITIRSRKLPDPQVYGNAGSFFKNPVIDLNLLNDIQSDFSEIPFHSAENNLVKIPAAWLIENAGWKGVRKGRIGTWPKQPLVIVNYGGASGQEILDFSEEIRADVARKFGITLEREVNVIN
jgi:UDP-N-acetylmuramate dehydrogenase